MAKDKNAATETNGTTENKRAGWHKVQTDRGVYSGEKGQGSEVIGFMLGLQDMPAVMGRPWTALILRLTEPCKVKKGDSHVVASSGEEILVPLNHQLTQHLSRAAVHPRFLYEVALKPTGQRKTRAGSMTTWDINVNPQPVVRGGADRMLAMQAQSPQLAPAGGDAEEVEIPFG